MVQDYTESMSGEIKNKYKFMKNLGSGAFGTVYKAVNKETNEVRAVKAIKRNKLSDVKAFEKEVNIHKQLNHPNICKIYEVWTNSKFFFIVMEFCEGGELLDFICENEYFPEQEAAFFMR